VWLYTPSCIKPDGSIDWLRLGSIVERAGGRAAWRLTAPFSEWLMGWPRDWTGSGPVEMESYLCRQRRHLSRWLLCFSETTNGHTDDRT